jgi:hypothetical protein
MGWTYPRSGMHVLTGRVMYQVKSESPHTLHIKAESTQAPQVVIHVFMLIFRALVVRLYAGYKLVPIGLKPYNTSVASRKTSMVVLLLLSLVAFLSTWFSGWQPRWISLPLFILLGASKKQTLTSWICFLEMVTITIVAGAISRKMTESPGWWKKLNLCLTQ